MCRTLNAPLPLTIFETLGQMAEMLPALGKGMLCGTVLFVIYERILPRVPSTLVASDAKAERERVHRGGEVAAEAVGSPKSAQSLPWVASQASPISWVAVAGAAAGLGHGLCEVTWVMFTDDNACAGLRACGLASLFTCMHPQMYMRGRTQRQEGIA